MSKVPSSRVTACNDSPVQSGRDFVLYWMVASRRVTWNFGLQRAVEWASELQKPLLVFEALRTGYQWASERHHRFIIDGMADNARLLDASPARYYAYIERTANEGRGLLSALSAQACVVVTDDYPAFFLPRMQAGAARQLDVQLERVDSNGLLPMRQPGKAFPTAYVFRRHLQKQLPDHLNELPRAHPLKDVSLPDIGELPSEVLDRWPDSSHALRAGEPFALDTLPIDHQVPAAGTPGGTTAAESALQEFLTRRLALYSADRNHPDSDATSELSPYLHFGHLSSHQVFAELTMQEGWDTDSLSGDASGKRAGWWGMSESAEAFLDQLVTWRELGFNMCAHREDYDQYESLPDWARQTLAEHANDPRPDLYSLSELERGATYDEIWNAAQTQLLREGKLHNYLRMLWGKKILEWSPSPQAALEMMIELNNKYALDGRDPNSYSGIFWCLGRYDRAWGPERQIFGKIRYMSSQNTARKLRLSEYLARYSS